MPDLEKDATINELLGKLRLYFGADGFKVVDDWEADLSAIGISGPNGSRPLVYVSTYKRPSGRYHADIEFPPAVGSDLPCRQGPSFESLDLTALFRLIEDTLGLRPLEAGDRAV